MTGARATLAAQAFGILELRVLGGRESMAYRAVGAQTQPGRDCLTSYGGGSVVGSATVRALARLDAEFTHSGLAMSTREYSNHRIAASLTWGALNR